MTSIDTYQALDTWVPGLIAILLWLLSVTLVLVGRWRCEYVPTFCVEAMKLFFPDLKYEDCETQEVKIDNTDLNHCALFILALIVIPLTVTTMFFTFWSVYLVEEEVRGDCVPNFECFPMNRSNYLQTTPVDNCSQLFELSDSNKLTDGDKAVQIRYECYRFIFRYVEGFSAAGGVLLFTAVISKLYFGILVAICNMESDCCKCLLTIVTWSIAGVLCLLFIVINVAVPLIREAVFQTTTDIILFLMYSVNFVAIVVCGIVVSLGI